MENTETRILAIISEVLYGNFVYECVKLDDILRAEHGAGSIDKVEIVMRAEKELCISIPDDKLEDFMSRKGTARDLINAVE